MPSSMQALSSPSGNKFKFTELEAQSRNHWATREDPPQCYFNSFYMVSLFSSLLLLQSVLHRAERGILSNLARPGH